MFRESELPSPTEMPSTEDDPALFDPAPEWFVPGLTPFHGETPDDEDDDQGLRAVLEQPDALARAWWASARGRRTNRVMRGSRRPSRRSGGSSYAD